MAIYSLYINITILIQVINADNEFKVNINL